MSSEINRETSSGMDGGKHPFTVYRNPDSPDLWPLVCAFREGRAEEKGKRKTLAGWRRNRSVHLIEREGARYVVKHILRGNPPWEKRLQERLRASFFPRLMRSVMDARKRGCAVAQNIHLVAERLENGICRETYVVLDYVEGEPFRSREECRQHGNAVAAAMRELHNFRIALGDVNHKNFIKRPASPPENSNAGTAAAGTAVAIIDLSARGFFRLDKIKDTVRMRMRYGIPLPVRGMTDKILFALIFIQQHLFYGLRLLRNKKTNPLRPGDE